MVKPTRLEELINLHTSKACIIFGSAPLSKNDLDTIDTLIKAEKADLIGIGDTPLRHGDDLQFKYWVSSNTDFINVQDSRQTSLLNNYFPGTHLIYSPSVLNSKEKNGKFNPDWIEKNLKIDWTPFDQRHFGFRKCVEASGSKCCHVIDYFKENSSCATIQELLQNHTGAKKHYTQGDTCFMHALAFAILSNYQSIYITGVSIPLFPQTYNYHPSKFATLIINLLKDKEGGDFLACATAFRKPMSRILDDIFLIANSTQSAERPSITNLYKRSLLNCIPGIEIGF